MIYMSVTGPPRLLRGGATRKGRAGGREGTPEAEKALKTAKNRIEWKNLWPSKRC